MGRLIDGDELLRHKTRINGPSGDSKYDVVFCDEIEEAPTVEAIPKADYENRLKADLVAMLTEIQLEIEELDVSDVVPEYQDGAEETKEYIANMIEEKIDKLKENT